MLTILPNLLKFLPPEMTKVHWLEPEPPGSRLAMHSRFVGPTILSKVTIEQPRKTPLSSLAIADAAPLFEAFAVAFPQKKKKLCRSP